MKKTLLTLLLIIASCAAIFAASSDTSGLSEYYDEQMQATEVVENAKVLEVMYDDTDEERPDVPIESDFRVQHLKIQLTSGSHKGETYDIQNQIQMAMPFKIICDKGDKILVQVDTNSTGKVTNLIIYDRDRSGVIYCCVISFVLMLLLIGRKQGLKSLLSLIVTIALVFFGFLPMIINGYSPLLSSFIVCLVATFVTMITIGGMNQKSFSAIFGTLAGTLTAMMFAVIAGRIAQLTGLGNEEAQMLSYIPQNYGINYQSLLFSGIAIGALGAVMDTALSISSAMNEIINTNSDISIKQLRKSGMTIGRDIIGSMSNTLILAYTSTNIPLILLLILFKTEFRNVMNLDVIASEILRATAGSIGLILTIPLTVNIMCIMESKRRDKIKLKQKQRKI
ncbi:MAG: YibE/F family protein [Sphaerochaetaceae bacterium]|nr:YibE/F family protein [Sphaerochaetaceae bacterium]